MKKMLLLAGAAALLAANQATAQETVIVSEQTDVAVLAPECGVKYYTPKSSNWFIEVGGGINTPLVENPGGKHPQVTANYGAGFGKWFSPYFGWRMEFNGGSIHWNTDNAKAPMGHAKTVNGNIDVMWDMFNSLGGANSERVFSIIPFVGVGGTFNWDYRNDENAYSPMREVKGKAVEKNNEWLLPVSAGLQLRFRLCKCVDFFAQARASFYGDSYNNVVYDKPVDINISALGGFSFNIGGRDFKSFDPCDYTAYINGLNSQVNDLRGALAVTSAALAAAESQLPCPEVTNAVVYEQVEAAPLMATVRFTINSARISSTEKVNVYNIAQWMKANPDQNVVITGYADKGTGTSAYNMKLSERRAKAVRDMLVNEYGINASRLATQADGSNVQPYEVNNWNRIVIFTVAE